MISVLIPNWNGKPHLAGCLPSLQAQAFRDFEIIVVDNGSVDGSVAYVQTHFPNTRLIALPENRGFSAAINAGIGQARGEFIALLNNDTGTHPGWLEALSAAAAKNPTVDCFASKILCLTEPSILDSAGDGYSRRGMAWNIGKGLPDSGTWDQPRWVFGASGAAAFYRRRFFDKIGLFDEDLFAFYEDVDLAFRGQLLQKKCLYVPDAIVFHRGGGTVAHHSSNNLFYCSRNAILVLAKNMPARLLLKNSVMIFFTYARHFLRHLARKGHRLSILKGYASALTHLPKALAKRPGIQRGRCLLDRELETRLKEQEQFYKAMRNTHPFPPTPALPRGAPPYPPQQVGRGKDGGGSKTLEVSVVIVHYRTEELLEQCLDRLFASLNNSGLQHEVFVVDNGSLLKKMAGLKAAFPHLHWLKNSKNEGFAKACNQGLQLSGGKYCLLLNPDCIVSPTTIARMVRRMEENFEVGLCGGRHRFPDGRLQPTCRAFPTLWNTFTDQLLLNRIFSRSSWLNAYKMAGWAHDQIREVDQLMGSCLMVRRKMLEQIGLLDERFFLYFEEVDLCLRAKQTGWKIMFFPDPEMEVVHAGGASSSQDLRLRDLQRYQSLCLWHQKHLPGSRAILAKAMAMIGLSLRTFRPWRGHGSV